MQLLKKTRPPISLRLILTLPLFLFFVSTTTIPSLSLAKEPIRTLEGLVTKVADGDTIRVQDPNGTMLRVRLYGIDAPEIEKINKKTGSVTKPGQQYGRQAREALAAKVYHETVRLDVMDVDRYKRLVCLVWLKGRNINNEMVAEGWAWAYRQYLDAPYASEFIGLEEQASGKKLGLWQQYNPQPPWEFRLSLRRK